MDFFNNFAEDDGDQCISDLEVQLDNLLLGNDNLTRRYAKFMKSFDQINDLVDQNSTQKKASKTVNGLTVLNSYDSIDDVKFTYLDIPATENHFNPPTSFK